VQCSKCANPLPDETRGDRKRWTCVLLFGRCPNAVRTLRGFKWSFCHGARSPKPVFSPGFFQGVSGVGYTLLRLIDPRLGWILLWE